MIEFSSAVTLSCFSSGSPTSFLWLNGSSEVTASERVQLSDGGSCLTIINVSRCDQGVRCHWIVVIPSVCPGIFFPNPLSFWQTEKISGASVKPPTNLPVEGNSVSLTCEASGSVFTRNWMKDGSDLTLADNMTLSDNNRVLTFNTVKRKDKGEYFCDISNPISSSSPPATLNRIIGPCNISNIGPSAAPSGHRVALQCTTDSVPPAHFSWMFNGNETHVNNSLYIVESLALHAESFAVSTPSPTHYTELL
uniref:Ig-like domain-containing protein n=1 Tax=Amphilophus citrinellus TaxID=61819 RepID=A0A3Q0S4F7_AMPCI